MEQTNQEQKRNWHDKYYKLLLLIPITFLIFCIIYMGIFHSKNNDFIYKDISLTGGTSATIYEKIDVNNLKQSLSGKLDDINTKEIYDLITNEQKAVIIETKTDGTETKKVLEEYLGYGLTDKNSSFEFTGSKLSESFYKQLLIAVLIAFVCMALVVFVIFRTFVPSLAVISCAFVDIFFTLTTANILGIKLSSAGIVAFIMLIGYSVDTDILLTNRVLKRKEDSVNTRIYRAFKTGITMTLTSIIAVGFALIIVSPFSGILTQIFTILIIGLGFDIFNTWVTNVSLLKWYLERKK